MYSSSLCSLDSKSLVIQMNCLLLIVVKWKEPPVKLLLTFRSAIRLSLTEIVNRVYFIFYLVSNGLRWKLSEPAASNSLWLWLIRVVSAFFHWSLVWSSQLCQFWLEKISDTLSVFVFSFDIQALIYDKKFPHEFGEHVIESFVDLTPNFKPLTL